MSGASEPASGPSPARPTALDESASTPDDVRFPLRPRGDPLVSVIVPSHRRASKLSAVLLALANGRYENVEVIVVHTPDAATARVIAAADRLDMRVRSIERRGGASAARNAGIEAASGEIIAFTDDDCVPPPDWLVGVAAVLERYDAVTVGGLNLPSDRVAHRLPARVDAARLRRNQRPPESARDEHGVAVGGFGLRTFGTSNVAYAASAIEEAGARFDEALGRGEDAAFQRAVLDTTGGRAAHLPVPVWHDRDYTVPEFLSQRYGNGRDEPLTAEGRSVAGSALGLLAAGLLLARELRREESADVAIGAWVGDAVARMGVIASALDRSDR